MAKLQEGERHLQVHHDGGLHCLLSECTAESDNVRFYDSMSHGRPTLNVELQLASIAIYGEEADTSMLSIRSQPGHQLERVLLRGHGHSKKTRREEKYNVSPFGLLQVNGQNKTGSGIPTVCLFLSSHCVSVLVIVPTYSYSQV